MNFPRIRNRFLLNLLRFGLLIVLVAVSGVAVGFAVGVPLGRVNFSSSDAIRLDQSRLAGSVDSEAAIVAASDLPVGWKEGDPNLAAFGILGNEFCGETIAMPTALSGVKASVFTSPSGDATLISQAVRVERWQAAREYVRDVDRVISDCDKFYQVDPDGKRQRVNIKETQSDPPITDFVARSFVAEDGSSVQSWSIMAVGDVIIGLRHLGKTAPQHSLLPDLQNHILMRTAPQTFAPGGSETTTTAADQSGDTSTTVIEGGAADEPTDTSVDSTPNSGGSQSTPQEPIPDSGASGDEPRD